MPLESMVMMCAGYQKLLLRNVPGNHVGGGAEQGFKRLMKLAKEMGEDWLEDNPIDGGEDSYSLYDVAYDLGDAALHSADPRDVEAAKKYIAGNTGSRNETSIKYVLRDALGDAVADARPSKRR